MLSLLLAGGSPKDMNLYQSCKAHMNAVFAVKKRRYHDTDTGMP